MPLLAAPDRFDQASRAYLEALTGLSGARLDSFLAEPDPEPVRLDGPKRCTVGISCGSTCIAKGKECRVKANPRTVARMRELLALPAAGQSSSRGAGGAVTAAKGLGQAAASPQRETLSQLRGPVLKSFGVKTDQQLKSSKLFKMATAGDDLDFKDRETWAKLHRQFIGVPTSERNQPEGPTVINGLDVLTNFRPWHTFGLNPKTATKDDVKAAFRKLAKKHHPDAGGDPRVMERLKVMKESVLALMG